MGVTRTLVDSKKHCIHVLQMHSLLRNKAFPPISCVQMDLGFIDMGSISALFGPHRSMSSS